LQSLLLVIIKAARIPGIQPNNVSIVTINIEPHPLSTTDKGGKIIAKKLEENSFKK